MNSKELLEQAEAKVKRINELSDDVGAAEDVLAMLGECEGEICFFVSGTGTTHLTPVLSPEKMQELLENVFIEIIAARNDKVTELKQLLGIQPVPVIPPMAKGTILALGEGRSIPHLLSPDAPEIIIPEQTPVEVMKAAVSEALHIIDPVEDKLAGILQEEAQKIETPKEDKSLDKYPAKKRGRQADYPEGMTKDTIQKMYQDEGKTINELAKHFGIPYSKMSNFISRNHLHRISNQKQDKPDKQPEETECP